MVYYLGRDVKVYITTESDEAQVDVASNAVSAISAGGTSEAATAALSCVDGDLNTTNQFTEGEYIKMTSTDGTLRIYVLSDGSESGSATTGTVCTASTDMGSANLASGIAALGTCIAVQSNLNTHNQATVLNEFRAAILHANGHNNKITCSTALTPADGAQTITLTQATAGSLGNKVTAVTTNPQITCANFTGGVSDPTGVAGANFAENLDISPAPAAVKNLTGVDLGIGVTDEDITYMGARTVLKAEIKKETTISLTRKKTDNVWDVVYNGPTAASEGWNKHTSTAETGDYGARWGVVEGTADNWYVMDGSAEPKSITDTGGTNVTFGYRVHIAISSGEVISIPACQLTGHTLSLNADGTTEETCELMSHVTPIIGVALDATNFARLTAADM
jgi:hypothetical protein